MAKYYRLTARWVQRVTDYNELPTGKVYYSIDDKTYHPANVDDFIDLQPDEVTMIFKGIGRINE